MPINEKYTALFEFDKTYHIVTKQTLVSCYFGLMKTIISFFVNLPSTFLLLQIPIHGIYNPIIFISSYELNLKSKSYIALRRWKKKQKQNSIFCRIETLIPLWRWCLRDFSRLMQWRLIKCTTEPATCFTELLNE